MNDTFIFQYTDFKNFKRNKSFTVLFLHQQKTGKVESLINEIDHYFQVNPLSDEIIVILPEYCDENFRGLFLESEVYDTFKRVPGFSKDYFSNFFRLYQFDDKGNLNSVKNEISMDIEKEFLQNLKRNGSLKIFESNGGLVESTPDHHFVFPSKKHSEKFIRTGNILVNSCEIFFLSFQLLPYLNKNSSAIYCDTSSINVLAFSLFELKRRFNHRFDSIPVFSFNSYEGLENKTSRFPNDSLILVSSSTSGNIISRLTSKEIADRDQILVLFFLGKTSKYINYKSNVLCNLTYSRKFPKGLEVFRTYDNSSKCKLCKNHSRPIRLQSDVFLSIQPKIQFLKLVKTDAPKFLSNFIKSHQNKTDNIIRTYYNETAPNENYEIFLDTEKLYELVKEGNAPGKFQKKLKRKINTYIPANTKYFIHLDDNGSKNLSNYIKSQIKFADPPEQISINELDKISNSSGSVVVVGSALVTGKNYFHVSRHLRKFDKLSIVYFIGLIRTTSENYHKTTVSNLGFGKDGGNTFPVVFTEKIITTPSRGNTSWDLEKNFFEDMIGEIDEDQNTELQEYVSNRLKILRENRKEKGLSNNVFLLKCDGTSLKLRKGFAYWDFKVKEDIAYQSQVYFTISSILHDLSNKPINSERSLKSSNYIKNLLAVENFNRFNDGIIQASLLRAGEFSYFSYDLDSDSSLMMTSFLISLIKNWNTDEGEALPEFLLALGIKKLRLNRDDLRRVLLECEYVDSELIKQFGNFLYDKLLEETTS